MSPSNALDSNALSRAFFQLNALAEAKNGRARHANFHRFGIEHAAGVDRDRKRGARFIQAVQHLTLEDHVTIQLEESVGTHRRPTQSERYGVLSAIEFGVSTVLNGNRRALHRRLHRIFAVTRGEYDFSHAVACQQPDRPPQNCLAAEIYQSLRTIVGDRPKA